MESFLTSSLACLCLPVYLFTFSNGLRHISRREAVVTRWLLFNLRITHLTGAAAVIYGIVQLVSGGIVFFGLFNAVVDANLLLGILSVIAGAAVGWAGTTFVRSLNQGVEEFNSAERAAEAFNYANQTGGFTVIYRQFGIGGTETTQTTVNTMPDEPQPVISAGEDQPPTPRTATTDRDIIEDADYRLLIEDNDDKDEDKNTEDTSKP